MATDVTLLSSEELGSLSETVAAELRKRIERDPWPVLCRAAYEMDGEGSDFETEQLRVALDAFGPSEESGEDHPRYVVSSLLEALLRNRGVRAPKGPEPERSQPGEDEQLRHVETASWFDGPVLVKVRSNATPERLVKSLRDLADAVEKGSFEGGRAKSPAPPVDEEMPF